MTSDFPVEHVLVVPTSLFHEIGLESVRDAVPDGPVWRRHRYMADPVVFLDIAMVKHECIRCSEATHSPGAGEGQVNRGGEHVGEAVEGQSGVVAEHAGAVGPEPHLHQLIIDVGR